MEDLGRLVASRSKPNVDPKSEVLSPKSSSSFRFTGILYHTFRLSNRQADAQRRDFSYHLFLPPCTPPHTRRPFHDDAIALKRGGDVHHQPQRPFARRKTRYLANINHVSTPQQSRLSSLRAYYTISSSPLA